MGCASLWLNSDIASPLGVFAVVGTVVLIVAFGVRVFLDVRQRAGQKDGEQR